MRPPISEGTSEILASYLEPCHFAKKELVLKAGVFCRYIWLIEKGSLRHYWFMEDGRKINTSFSIEGYMVFSMDEVYFGKTSEEYAQTMEPVDAWRIPVGDMNRLFRESQPWIHCFISRNTTIHAEPPQGGEEGI